MDQEITRQIEIDAGHRIPNHYSACRNFHGHRYFIQATISGNICTTESDSSEGMILDFKFLKETMMDVIHEPHDHSMMLWKNDKALPSKIVSNRFLLVSRYMSSFIMNDEIMGKLVIMNFVPTAENLAKYWFTLLQNALNLKTTYKLTRVRVYETPNCWADYNG